MNAIRQTGGFRRWVGSLLLIAILLGATFFFVTSYFPGDTYLDRL